MESCGSIGKHLEPFGSIGKHLEAFGAIGKHLEASGVIWIHLEASEMVPASTHDTPKRAPRRHPGGNQGAPRGTQGHQEHQSGKREAEGSDDMCLYSKSGPSYLFS